MTTLVTLTGNVADLVGADFDARRTKVWIEANVDRIFDNDNDQVRLGVATPDDGVSDEGSFTFTDLIATNSTGVNPTGFQYRLWVDYPKSGGDRARVKESFGWYSLTADSDLTELAEAEEAPANYQSAFLTEAEALLAAQTAISGIDDTDSAVAALIEDELVGPLTTAALSATIETAVQIVTSTIAADGTDQTAALQAEVDALGANGGVILIPAGTYVFTGTVTMAARVKLMGIGRPGASVVATSGGTILSHEPTTAINFIDTPAGASYCQNLGLANLIIKGNANSAVGVHLNNPQHSDFERLRISGFDKNLVVKGALLATFADIRSTGSRTSCLHVTGSVSTTLTFRRCYFGQTTGVAASRPIIIDKDAAVDVTFSGGGAESTELGVSIGAGVTATFEAFYTENIPATAAAVAVFEIGKTGAPTTASDGATVTVIGGSLAGTNSGVFTGTSMFDLDYCHNLTVIGAKLKRVRDVVLKTANSKKGHFTGCAQVQVTNAIGNDTWATVLACTYGGVNEYDTFARAITATATIDFASMALGGTTFATMTLTGAVVNDAVALGPPASPEAGMMVWPRISAANTGNLRAFNIAGTNPLDPSAATYRLTILRAPTQ